MMNENASWYAVQAVDAPPPRHLVIISSVTRCLPTHTANAKLVPHRNL